MATATTIFQGELDKQGSAALKLYHPRFVVIKEDGWIYSFKSKKDANIWKSAKRLMQVAHKRGRVQREPHPGRAFSVTRGAQTEHFRAADPETAGEWVETLGKIIGSTSELSTTRRNHDHHHTQNYNHHDSLDRSDDHGHSHNGVSYSNDGKGGGSKHAKSLHESSGKGKDKSETKGAVLGSGGAETAFRSAKSDRLSLAPHEKACYDSNGSLKNANQDDSFQTASELNKGSVDTRGLFDVHFPEPDGKCTTKWEPLQLRTIDLSVRCGQSRLPGRVGDGKSCRDDAANCREC